MTDSRLVSCGWACLCKPSKRQRLPTGVLVFAWATCITVAIFVLTTLGNTVTIKCWKISRHVRGVSRNTQGYAVSCKQCNKGRGEKQCQSCATWPRDKLVGREGQTHWRCHESTIPPTKKLHGDQTRLRGIRNAVIRGSSHSTLTGRERAVGQVYATSTATMRSWVLRRTTSKRLKGKRLRAQG